MAQRDYDDLNRKKRAEQNGRERSEYPDAALVMRWNYAQKKVRGKMETQCGRCGGYYSNEDRDKHVDCRIQPPPRPLRSNSPSPKPNSKKQKLPKCKKKQKAFLDQSKAKPQIPNPPKTKPSRKKREDSECQKKRKAFLARHAAKTQLPNSPPAKSNQKEREVSQGQKEFADRARANPQILDLCYSSACVIVVAVCNDFITTEESAAKFAAEIAADYAQHMNFNYTLCHIVCHGKSYTKGRFWRSPGVPENAS